MVSPSQISPAGQPCEYQGAPVAPDAVVGVEAVQPGHEGHHQLGALEHRGGEGVAAVPVAMWSYIRSCLSMSYFIGAYILA